MGGARGLTSGLVDLLDFGYLEPLQNAETELVEQAVAQQPAHGRRTPEDQQAPRGQLGDSQLALSTDRAVTDVGLEPSGGNPFELVVWCDDVDRETARLSAVGASVVVEPYDHLAGHRGAYLADPDGNGVALVDVDR